MDKSILRNILGDGTNDSFRLNVEFNEHDFNLTVLKNSNAWTVHVEHSNISMQAKKLEIEVDQYLNEIRNYLKSTCIGINLSFKNNSFVIDCTLENNMKVVYFSCNLKKVNYSECVEMLMEKFYVERNNSLKRLLTIGNENDILKKSKNELELKVNEFIERKKTDEEELYSNYILVLNEKKRRIQHLNELLEAFRRGRSTINSSVKAKKGSKKLEPVQEMKKEKEEIVSASDSEDDYDTDNEKSKERRSTSNNNSDNEVNWKKNEAIAIPTTSGFDFLDDDSPPKHLPKRIKMEKINTSTYTKPSTSKDNPNNEKQNDKFDCKITDNTPNVNFSTQDLLDNM